MELHDANVSKSIPNDSEINIDGVSIYNKSIIYFTHSKRTIFEFKFGDNYQNLFKTCDGAHKSISFYRKTV